MNVPPESIDDLSLRLLGRESATLDAEEHRVIAQMALRQPISRDAGEDADDRSSFGERLADRVAAVGGSWSFIIGFALVMAAWMLLNTDVLAHWNDQFDPYPYVFLNLMLSTLAAVQAPLILMSQNRQASKDRIAASHDYEVNLHAELEIMRLHAKLDALRTEQLAAVLERQDAILARLDRQLGAPAAD